MHHIFGSGEFTIKTPAMETRIPEAVFAVGEQDATRLNLQEVTYYSKSRRNNCELTCTSNRIFTYRLYWLPSWFSSDSIFS